MKFDLKRPCPHCPFRKDIPGFLRRERASGIARDIANGSTFACHETTVPDEWDEGELVADENSQFCAGALLVMEKSELPNQIVRISERLGVYDPARLDMAAPVHDSFAAFVYHHGGTEERDDEIDECCSVVEHGCEAPAGYMVNGVAVPAEPEGEVHICESCGQPVCDNCSDDNGICLNCSEENERLREVS